MSRGAEYDEQRKSTGKVKEIVENKRKLKGAAAHRVLKRVEGKRVRLTQQQLAEYLYTRQCLVKM
jgi:hypothetical protein